MGYASKLFQKISKEHQYSENVEKKCSKSFFYGEINNFFIFIMYICQSKRHINYYGKKLNRIKTLLVDKGKINQWLAEQLGKNRAAISKWCTNKSQPSLEMMMTIAKLLQVDLNDLVCLEEISYSKIKKTWRNSIFFLPVPRFGSTSHYFCRQKSKTHDAYGMTQ